MFIETTSYRRVGAMGGIVGSQKGRWAIIGNDGWSYNFTGQKGNTHYTNAMVKTIRQLDNTFKIGADGKAKSEQFTIKIIEFGREVEVADESK